MPVPDTPPVDETPRQRFLRQVWTFFNSSLFITLFSALVAALIAHAFADRQAQIEDMAARHAELSRDLVELQLRAARLNVIQAQGADRSGFSAEELGRIGARAKAIVSADARTVTTDPSFKDIHLVTLLGRAETAAGLQLSNKGFLLDFTDRTDADALALTPYILCRTRILLTFLAEHFQSGDFPLRAADLKARAYDSSVYTLINSRTACASSLVADATG